MRLRVWFATTVSPLLTSSRFAQQVGNVPSGFSLLDEDKSTLLMSKEVDGKNVIVMKFAGGECPDSDSGKGTSAEIRFECDVFDRLQSTPAVTASTSCAYVVTWKTCLACPGDDPCNGAAGPEPTLAEPGYEAAKTTRPSSERSPSSHGKRKRSGGRGITVAIIIIFVGFEPTLSLRNFLGVFVLICRAPHASSAAYQSVVGPQLLGAAAMLFIHPKLRVLVTGLIDRSGGRSSTVEYSSLSMGWVGRFAIVNKLACRHRVIHVASPFFITCFIKVYCTTQV